MADELEWDGVDLLVATAEWRKPNCGMCRFFHSVNPSFKSQCRAHPPRRDDDGEPCWPPTYVDGWCGEWRPRHGEFSDGPLLPVDGEG